MQELIRSMGWNTIALLAAFWSLWLLTLRMRDERQALGQRRTDEWLLDLAGLLVQGSLIPLLQTTLVAGAVGALCPRFAGRLVMHPVFAFLLCFAGIDYAYYWNHRLLHGARLWPLHAVHHSAPRMDVLTTSRNTLWTNLLIVYLWLNGFMLFVLESKGSYIAAITLTAALDIWRHSPIHLSAFLSKAVETILILPQDHAWHHSADKFGVNFGANLNLWDRLHGTWHRPGKNPQSLGVPLKISLRSQLLWPFS